MRRILLIAICLTGIACYRMVPLGTSVPPTGITVVADLNNRGSDSLARFIGPGIVNLRGDVLAATDSSMQLAMRLVVDRRGIETFWTKEAVTVKREYVERLQERKLSARRSIIAGVAIAVGLFLITDAVSGFAGVFGGGGGGNGVVD